MKCRHFLIATGVFTFMCVSAWAQSSQQPLNLRLPTDNAIVDAADTQASRNGSVASNVPDPSSSQGDTASPYPLTSAFHYDDANPRNRAAPAPACDDATYNQPQVHGSLGMGVVAGNHVSGNYQSGVVNVTKALGSCENPTGVVSLSVGVGKEHFEGRRRWEH